MHSDLPLSGFICLFLLCILSLWLFPFCSAFGSYPLIIVHVTDKANFVTLKCAPQLQWCVLCRSDVSVTRTTQLPLAWYTFSPPSCFLTFFFIFKVGLLEAVYDLTLIKCLHAAITLIKMRKSLLLRSCLCKPPPLGSQSLWMACSGTSHMQSRRYSLWSDFIPMKSWLRGQPCCPNHSPFISFLVEVSLLLWLSPKAVSFCLV